MICEKCGEKLKEGELICPECGFENKKNKEEKIVVTKKDDQVEYVDPPVIVEAHTFIDEESFAQKVKDILWLFGLLLLAVVGSVLYFVVMPNVSTKNQSKNHEVEEYSFSSEDWTVGEFMIDDEFYKMNQTFSTYFKRGWSFDTESFDQGIDDLVEKEKEIEDVTLYNSFHEGVMISVSLRNQRQQATKIKNCYVWSVSVDNAKTDVGVSFTLPGQITNGSKELEIESIYGKLQDDYKDRDEDSMTTIYHYQNGNKSLDLTVYDNGGLKAFKYIFK